MSLPAYPSSDHAPHAAGDALPHPWADCPRCGEHWPQGDPYCNNCGWMPSVAATVPPPSRAERGWQLGAAAAGLAALVAAGLAWWSTQDHAVQPNASQAPPSAPPTATPVVASVASPPVSSTVSSTASPSASSTAPPAAQPAAVTVQRPAATAVLNLPAAEAFARGWLATEANAVDDGAAVNALRPYYADVVIYRGQPQADWAAVAADKLAFMRRWPKRQYELLGVTPHADAVEGRMRLTLRVRWQLENQGRWRRGESLTVLTLRSDGGRWRIVAEQAA